MSAVLVKTAVFVCTGTGFASRILALWILLHPLQGWNLCQIILP